MSAGAAGGQGDVEPPVEVSVAPLTTTPTPDALLGGDIEVGVNIAGAANTEGTAEDNRVAARVSGIVQGVNVPVPTLLSVPETGEVATIGGGVVAITHGQGERVGAAGEREILRTGKSATPG